MSQTYTSTHTHTYVHEEKKREGEKEKIIIYKQQFVPVECKGLNEFGHMHRKNTFIKKIKN